MWFYKKGLGELKLFLELEVEKMKEGISFVKKIMQRIL